jgi:hypothetical protein
MSYLQGYYTIEPYTIVVDGKEIKGNTIHYYTVDGEKFLIEEYYGSARTGYVQKR